MSQLKHAGRVRAIIALPGAVKSRVAVPMTAAKDVLIIEDDEMLRDLVADWMAAAGYGVRIAASGDVGLAAVGAR